MFGLYCVGCSEGSATGLVGGVNVGACVASVSVTLHCGPVGVLRFIHRLGHVSYMSGFGKSVA